MKPTIVLVHGAFKDASSWAQVAAILRASQHEVFSAANPLRSVAGDSASLAGFLGTIEGPIVLVRRVERDEGWGETEAGSPAPRMRGMLVPRCIISLTKEVLWLPLVARQGRSPSGGLVSLPSRSAEDAFAFGFACEGGRCGRERPAGGGWWKTLARLQRGRKRPPPSRPSYS
jgi:hypothetical protein